MVIRWCQSWVLLSPGWMRSPMLVGAPFPFGEAVCARPGCGWQPRGYLRLRWLTAAADTSWKAPTSIFSRNLPVSFPPPLRVLLRAACPLSVSVPLSDMVWAQLLAPRWLTKTLSHRSGQGGTRALKPRSPLHDGAQHHPLPPPRSLCMLLALCFPDLE